MKNNAKKNVLQYISIFMFFALIFVLFNVFSAKEHEFTYDEFIDNLNNGNVTELNVVPRSNSSVYEIKGNTFTTIISKELFSGFLSVVTFKPLFSAISIILDIILSE